MPEITKEYLLQEKRILEQKLLQAQMEHFGVEGALAYIERMLEFVDKPASVDEPPHYEDGEPEILEATPGGTISP